MNECGIFGCVSARALARYGDEWDELNKKILRHVLEISPLEQQLTAAVAS